jgi:hypothetical protein
MMVMRNKYLDDDDDRVVADGEVVRVPLHLMDARQVAVYRHFHPDNHRPHFVTSNDAAALDARREAKAAYDEMCKRATEAWRAPQHADAPQPGSFSPPEATRRHLRDGPDDDVEKIRKRTRSEYLGQLQNAWRTNPQAATAIERQGEQWRGGR